MNEFEKRFKSFDNKKLFAIVKEAGKYQPIAVDAAKSEIALRNLSKKEILRINIELAENDFHILERQNKIDVIINKANSIGGEILNTIDPVQKESMSLERRINVISIFFAIIALQGLYSEFAKVGYLFSGRNDGIFLGVIYYFIFPIIIPFALAGLFWLRNKLGWALVLIFSALEILGALGGIWFYLNRDTASYSGTQSNFVQMMDSMIYVHPIFHLLIILVYGVVVWLI